MDLGSVEVDWMSCKSAVILLSIPLFACLPKDSLPDAQWLRIHSFLSTGSGIRVGKETPCLLSVEAMR